MEDGHFYFDKEEKKFYSSKGGKSNKRNKRRFYLS